LFVKTKPLFDKTKALFNKTATLINVLVTVKSAQSPYWLNGTLLPDVRPTAGKCQADSREQNGD